jgi:hypothetical protein
MKLCFIVFTRAWFLCCRHETHPLHIFETNVVMQTITYRGHAAPVDSCRKLPISCTMVMRCSTWLIEMVPGCDPFGWLACLHACTLLSVCSRCQVKHLLSCVLQETPVQTKVLPTYQDNPLRKYTPTWEKFSYLGIHLNYKWNTSQDWLDDYTYYAEIIGDDQEDWWSVGLSTPSNGDADIPQPKVFRSYAKSDWTMLDFVKYAFSLSLSMLAPHLSLPCLI